MYAMHKDLTAVLYTWPAAPANTPRTLLVSAEAGAEVPAAPESAARQEPRTPSRELAFKKRDCAVQCQINTTPAITRHEQTSSFSLPFSLALDN